MFHDGRKKQLLEKKTTLIEALRCYVDDGNWAAVIRTATDLKATEAQVALLEEMAREQK